MAIRRSPFGRFRNSSACESLSRILSGIPEIAAALWLFFPDQTTDWDL
jgi:hypothetical protein